ncbi:hypothetical protein [Amycolatopsis sp. SB7-3]|uniref:hypothetical protein n=1 Tax=Amycolatopsis sp. SB7-3 TaxID=3373438 RepID=UPI0037444452
MGALLDLPPEAGAWQVEIQSDRFRLHRGQANDLTTFPSTGFSCPEDALSGLVVTLKLVATTKAYLDNPRRPVGPCAITLESGRASIHIPVITDGARLGIRYGEVPILLRRVESLLSGTYGEVVREDGHTSGR